VKALSGLQKCFSQCAEFHKRGKVRKAGRYENEIIQLAELYIVKLCSSIPTAEVETRPGSPDLFDTAERVYSTVKDWLTFASSEISIEQAKNIIPSEELMQQLVDATQEIFPSEEREYEASIRFDSDPALHFGIEGRDKVVGLSMRAAAARLPDIIEEEVRVTGLARIGAHDKPLFREVREIEFVSPEEFVVLKVKNREFHMRYGIKARTYCRSGLWFWEYSELGIIAYGESRDEVRKAFIDEIAFLWDMYAVVDEEELAEDAKQLKRKLLDIIIDVREDVDG
jgi:hypothetical protein